MHENTEGRRKKHYSWVWAQSACYMISEKIKHDLPNYKEAFTAVVAFPRGGLVPAVSLSHLLGVDKVMTVDELTVSLVRQRSQVLFEDAHTEYGTYLLVDDIADTGATFAEYLEKHRDLISNGNIVFVTASLCYRPSTVFMPDYTVQDIEDAWVVFPWEQFGLPE